MDLACLEEAPWWPAAPCAATGRGPGTRAGAGRDTGTPALRRNRLPPEPRLARGDDRLGAVLDLDLVEDARDVVADGLVGQAQARGDLGIVEALRDELEDIALARRELGEFAAACRREEPGQRLEVDLPGGLVLDEHVVVALQREESRVGDQAGEPA